MAASRKKIAKDSVKDQQTMKSEADVLSDTIPTMHLSADEAIKDRDSDELGRRRFAERLASTIRRRVGEESVVIALMGPWGCGKTSIKNMVLDALAADESTNPHLVEFEPWLWKSQEDLTTAFFNEVGIVLKRTTTADSQSRADLWGRYGANFGAAAIAVKNVASIAALATANPALGLLAKGAEHLTDVTDAMKKGQDAFAADAKKSLSDQRKDLRASLLEIDKPILVVIDDIDRLTAAEVPLIFQLVKAHANFPNLIYLLLFQRESVERCLEAVAPGSGRGSGREYIEKIVQVPFDVPVASSDTLQEKLGVALSEVLGDELSEALTEERRWRNFLGTDILDYFENLRDVRRFLNSFAFNFDMFYGSNGVLEVNPIDLIILEVVRFFEPDVYVSLPPMKQLLLTGKGRHTYTSEQESEARAAMKALLDLASTVHRRALKEALQDLFPAGAWVFSDEKTSRNYDNEEALRELRVSHVAFFDRYFQLAVPQGDLPQADLDRLIKATGDREKLRAVFMELEARKLLKVALERISAHIDKVPFSDSANVVNVLLDLEPVLITSRADLSAFKRVDSLVVRFIRDLLSRNDSEGNSGTLRAAVEQSRSLWLPYFVASYDARDKELPHGGGGKFVMTEEDAKKAIDAAISRISSAAETGELDDHPLLSILLHVWKERGNSVAVQTYIDRLLDSPKALLRFLDSCVSTSYGGSSNDRVGYVNKEISLESIELFMNIDDLKEKVDALTEEEVLNSAVEGGRQAIRVFRGMLERRVKGEDRF